MHFDHAPVGILQEDLVPARDRPTTIIRVADTHLVAFAHEALDIVRPETDMTVTHRIDELFHLEPGIKITLGPVEFDVAVREKINSPRISPIITFAADDFVSWSIDRSEIEQIFIEICADALALIRAKTLV